MMVMEYLQVGTFSRDALLTIVRGRQVGHDDPVEVMQFLFDDYKSGTRPRISELTERARTTILAQHPDIETSRAQWMRVRR